MGRIRNQDVARWLVAGVEAPPPVLRGATIEEPLPDFPAPTEGQYIVADYKSLGLTLGRHPLALLRSRLSAMRLSTAEELRRMPAGRLARTTGIVTCRQRPGTASGVVFVTLEDETGCTNVIVWNDLVEKQRKELLASRLMTVYGVIERDGEPDGENRLGGEVVHLLAKRLVDHSALLGSLVSTSRDFH